MSVPNVQCECGPPRAGTKWYVKDRKVLAREKITLDSDKSFAIEKGQGYVEQIGSGCLVGTMLRMPVVDDQGVYGWVTPVAIDPKTMEQTTLLERRDYNGIPEWTRTEREEWGR